MPSTLSMIDRLIYKHITKLPLFSVILYTALFAWFIISFTTSSVALTAMWLVFYNLGSGYMLKRLVIWADRHKMRALERYDPKAHAEALHDKIAKRLADIEQRVKDGK